MTLSFSHFYSLENSQARYEQAIQMMFERLSPVHCLIGQFINGKTQVQTICYAKDGELKPNITYDLAGTPCNDAQDSQGVCMLNTCLQETYVEDELLRLLNINSYAGVTLRALDHTPIGIMVCMYEDERLLDDAQQSFLKELSYIVGAELNHNLEVASQDLILKQLAKGERIAKLSSWNWHLDQDKHWFSKEMQYLIGNHHDIDLSLDCFLECLDPRDKERLEGILSQLQQGHIEQVDTTVRHKLISKRKGLMRIIGHIENETGPISERVFTATVQDISQINALTKQLELTNVVFEHATDAIMITDHENKIIMVNKAFEDLTGYKGNELMGQDPGVLSSGQQSKQFYKKMWHALETSGTWKGEIYNRRKNGQIFPEELTLSVVKDELNQPTNYVAIFRDITEWKRNEAQLTFYANHEPLTGLTNRRSFLENLEQVISENRAQKKESVILFIGLDRFKEVNDIYGSEIGDNVLLSVAKRIKNGVRRQDIVCRYGGDEFAILLQNSGIENAMLVANKIQSKISLPYVFNELSVEITACIGVAELVSNQPLTASTLISHATHALGSAKKTSPGQIALYNESIQNAYLQKIHLRDKLKEAIKFQLLSVHYQPIIDSTTGKICKFEALVRWSDSELGAISPGQFIPIAEEFGLIHQIGQFVLEKSCHDLAKMHSLGHTHISISINRSVNEFKASNDQYKQIIEAIEKNNLPYNALTIEVTESVAANQYTWQVLGDLQNKGVQIALDDFCTGYSSLSHLLKSKVDFVKIDRSFIDTLIDDKKKQAMIKYLVELGDDIGTQLIAEGVEKIEQVNMLKQFGCHKVQGFFYSPAQPISACLSMLEE